MKFAKSALFAATMLSAVSASAVEVSGNVALGSDYFFRGLISLVVQLSLVALMLALKTVFT